MKLTVTFAPAILCVLATNVLAVQPANKGANYFTCEASVLALDEGHVLVTWKGKGIQVTEAKSPDHNSHIDCAGTIENMADKSFKASGYCLHTDTDGDKWIDRWWNDSSMKKGAFEYTGVSGKWAGMKGMKGTFMFTDLSSQTECRGISNWEMTL